MSGELYSVGAAAWLQGKRRFVWGDVRACLRLCGDLRLVEDIGARGGAWRGSLIGVPLRWRYRKGRTVVERYVGMKSCLLVGGARAVHVIQCRVQNVIDWTK